MRQSEFQRACSEEFGDDYARVLIRDHWLTALGGTAQEAFERGVPARDIWRAMCVDLDVPVDRWHGRGLLEVRE